jgi:CheY-like chemotaxis protein
MAMTSSVSPRTAVESRSDWTERAHRVVDIRSTVPQRVQESARRLTGPRILVVDDDDDVLDFVCGVLESERMTIVRARSGEAALELARSEPVNLAILDVVMPGCDGWSVCRELRRDPVRGAIPVVMMTGLTTQDDELQSLACGATAFLAKPATRQQVRSVVQRLLWP